MLTELLRKVLLPRYGGEIGTGKVSGRGEVSCLGEELEQ